MRMRPKSRSRRFSKPVMLPRHDTLAVSDALKSMIQNEATRPLVFSPAYYRDEADTAGH